MGRLGKILIMIKLKMCRDKTFSITFSLKKKSFIYFKFIFKKLHITKKFCLWHFFNTFYHINKQKILKKQITHIKKSNKIFCAHDIIIGVPKCIKQTIMVIKKFIKMCELSRQTYIFFLTEHTEYLSHKYLIFYIAMHSSWSIHWQAMRMTICNTGSVCKMQTIVDLMK